MTYRNVKKAKQHGRMQFGNGPDLVNVTCNSAKQSREVQGTGDLPPSGTKFTSVSHDHAIHEPDPARTPSDVTCHVPPHRPRPRPNIRTGAQGGAIGDLFLFSCRFIGERLKVALCIRVCHADSGASAQPDYPCAYAGAAEQQRRNQARCHCSVRGPFDAGLHCHIPFIRNFQLACGHDGDRDEPLVYSQEPLRRANGVLPGRRLSVPRTTNAMLNCSKCLAIKCVT